MSQLATRIDGPVAVIGDVHGQVDQLVVILDRLRQLPDFESRWIVLIGDLVDRGPEDVFLKASKLRVFLAIGRPRAARAAGRSTRWPSARSGSSRRT